RVDEGDLRILTPLADLTLYQWGSGTAKDYFCPTCGILPFRRPSHPTAKELLEGVEPFDGWGVNARCLDGIDLSDVPKKQIRGSRI
ncbi:MAG TPA: GFA family protein, partial [Gammaproteobacteria bacterium]